MLGEQPPSAGEAAGAPRLRLVRAHRAGLAGPEAVSGEGAGRALAWKTEATAPSGPALSPLLPWEGTEHQGWGGWGGTWGRKPGVPEPATPHLWPSGAPGCVARPGLAFSRQQEEKLGVWGPQWRWGVGWSLLSERLSPRAGRTGAQLRAHPAWPCARPGQSGGGDASEQKGEWRVPCPSGGHSELRASPIPAGGRDCPLGSLQTQALSPAPPRDLRHPFPTRALG